MERIVPKELLNGSEEVATSDTNNENIRKRICNKMEEDLILEAITE